MKEIHGTEVSWTLGKMVLYASSQIPPAEDALAVGFGTNQPGIPSDFQFAGGSHLPLVGDPASVDDWEEAFSDWSVSGVLSGLLLFILILAFASFCYCSSYSYSLSSCRRTRRETCRQHLSSKFRRNSKQSRSRTLANRFFLFTNGNSAGYERAGAYSPTTSDYHDNSSSSNDVELGSRSSTGKADYYDHPDYFNVEPAMAKSSGWATRRSTQPRIADRRCLHTILTAGLLKTGPRMVLSAKVKAQTRMWDLVSVLRSHRLILNRYLSHP